MNSTKRNSEAQGKLTLRFQLASNPDVITIKHARLELLIEFFTVCIGNCVGVVILRPQRYTTRAAKVCDQIFFHLHNEGRVVVAEPVTASTVVHATCNVQGEIAVDASMARLDEDIDNCITARILAQHVRRSQASTIVDTVMGRELTCINLSFNRLYNSSSVYSAKTSLRLPSESSSINPAWDIVVDFLHR